MAILKKIKGATLIEVLTASVLIIIVFMIASFSFNTVLGNQVKRDKSAIENKIKELEYFSIHQKINFPYAEDFDGWEITIVKIDEKMVLSYDKEGKKYEKVIVH